MERYYNNNQKQANKIKTIEWVEKLLHTPIDDYRKNTVSLVLAPYLITIKGLKYNEAYKIIKDWLAKCNSVKRLDSRFDSRIEYSLKECSRHNFKPMRLETLHLKNKQLYQLLTTNLVGGRSTNAR